jgi:hypothetical protein
MSLSAPTYILLLGEFYRNFCNPPIKSRVWDNLARYLYFLSRSILIHTYFVTEIIERSFGSVNFNANDFIEVFHSFFH